VVRHMTRKNDDDWVTKCRELVVARSKSIEAELCRKTLMECIEGDMLR
jgi:hypothetical protein